MFSVLWPFLRCSFSLSPRQRCLLPSPSCWLGAELGLARCYTTVSLFHSEVEVISPSCQLVSFCVDCGSVKSFHYYSVRPNSSFKVAFETSKMSDDGIHLKRGVSITLTVLCNKIIVSHPGGKTDVINRGGSLAHSYIGMVAYPTR